MIFPRMQFSAADIAEKLVHVAVRDVRGSCPQNMVLLAIFGDTAAVEAAVGAAKEPVISHAVGDVMVAVRAAVKELVADLVLQTTAVLLVVIQEQQFKKGKFMVVKISPEHSDYVEKLFFEYNALKDLIVYMSKDSDVREEDKDYYLEKLGTMYSKLELAKEQVVAKYAPDSYKTYKFLFPECSIQFD